VPWRALVSSWRRVRLLGAFPSLVVAIRRRPGFVLSIGAALCAVVAFLPLGWAHTLVAPLDGPVISFVSDHPDAVLFGLAMDYESSCLPHPARPN